MGRIEKQLNELVKKYGEIPIVFTPYNLTDLSHGICPTLTTNNCGDYGSMGGGTIK